VFMDDGDALPISLLHTFDRIRADGTLGDKSFWICKPRKGHSGKELKRRARERKLAAGKQLTEDEKRDAEKLEQIEQARGKPWSRIEDERPKEYFINVNGLFQAILADPRLKSVQNPVLFVVMAIIMGGTDYFAHGANGASFLPGIGVQRIIWPTLFERASEYSHMIQASMAYPPDPQSWREVVIDHDAMIAFFNACYLKVNDCSMAEVRAKYEKRENERIARIKKKLAKLRSQADSNPAEICKVEASLATPRAQNQILSEEEMHVLVRHLLKNIMYWRNAWKCKYERYPDIFERDDHGNSLWGYNHMTRSVSNSVSPHFPFPVDEVYRRFFFAERKQNPREAGTPPTVQVSRRKFP
jgi:hypothetical protein